MPKFILIHKDDALGEVVEKLRTIKESEVYLIIPDNSEILEGMNSKILVGEAEELGKKVYLSVFSEETKSELEEVKSEELQLSSDQLPPEKEKAFRDFFSRTLSVPEILKNKSRAWQIFWGFTGLLLMIFLISYFSPFFGYVQVTITPKSDLMKFDLNISAVTDLTQVSSDDLKIPGQVFQIIQNETKTFAASGKKELKTKASGFINVYNAYSSKEQTLVKGTRFLSKDKKLFRSVKTIIVPGAYIDEGQIIPSSIQIEALADQIGSEYNIGPADFVIPGFEGTPKYVAFYGKSDQSMKGGANGLVSVVTKDDLVKAKENLSEFLRQKLEKEIKTKIPSNLKFLDNALVYKILEEKTNEKEGNVADQFDFTLKMSIKAIVFNESDINLLVNNYLKKKLTSDQELKKETLSINYDNSKANWDKDSLDFSLKGEEKVFIKIDTEKLRARLLGQSQGEIEGTLGSWSGIKKSEVTFWPVWLRTAPYKADKIYLTIEDYFGSLNEK